MDRPLANQDQLNWDHVLLVPPSVWDAISRIIDYLEDRPPIKHLDSDVSLVSLWLRTEQPE